MPKASKVIDKDEDDDDTEAAGTAAAAVVVVVVVEETIRCSPVLVVAVRGPPIVPERSKAA